MDTNLRSSGIEGLGDMSWGTHFCLFYKTKEDLLDFFIPFFKAGLENREFCLCVASEPVIAKEVERVLREAVPDFERYLNTGQIEITPYTEWYLQEGRFDPVRVRQRWIDKLEQALAKGYTGMRFAANIFWLEKPDWDSFAEYEGELEEALSHLRIKGLCAYNLDRASAEDVFDVIHHHQFTLVRRNGIWESLEGPKLRQAHEETHKLNADLERHVIDRTELQPLWWSKPPVILRYGIAILSVMAALIVLLRMETDLLADAPHVSVLLIAVIISTWFGGVGPGLLAIALSALAFSYYFLPPIHSFAVETNQLPRLLLFTLPALFIVLLSAAQRSITESLRQARDNLQEAYQELKRINAVLLAENIERKRIEEALLASEARLQAAIDAADIGLWDWDLVSGQIIWLGHHGELFGFAAGEFDGTYLSFEKRVHPEDLEELNKVVQCAREEGSEYTHEYRVVWPDGSIHWIAGRGRFVYNQTGQPVRMYGAVLDITERKQAEEAIRKSEQVLREAESLGHTGSWEQNLVTGEIFNTEENLRLFFGNDHSKGGDFEDYAETVHPDDREYVMQRRVQLLTERGPSDIEYRVAWPDGSVHVIFGRATVVYDELGQAIRVYGTNVDITERKRAEESLRRSESNFRTLADKSLQGIAIFQEQKMVYANPAISKITGYTVEELKSMSVEQIIELTHPIDRPIAVERVRNRMAGEALSPSIELRMLRRDGSTVWVQAFNNPIEYNGQPALLSTTIDITERKQAEFTIRSLLQISEKLTATLDIDVLLDSLVIEAIKLIDAEIGWSGLRTEEGMVCHTHIGRDLQVIPFKYLWPPGVGLPGWVLVHKVPYVMNDPQSDKLIISEIRERFGVKAAIDTPILDPQGEVIGFFEVNNKKNGARFSESDMEKLVAVSRIASIALQNAMSYANLEREEKALRESQLQSQQLSRQLLQVQESERRALTTELHDRVGQNLTGLSIILQNMKALLSEETAQTLAGKFDDAQTLLEDITRQIRDIMAELHLPELEEYGLAAALEIYAERAASRGNLELTADLPDLTPPRLPSNVRIALFRSAQEAIINVLRHADATQLAVSLHRENGRVRLRVEDDGRGFDPNVASQNEAPSWGLKIMRERIESIGGKVQIESEPGHGTRVTFEIERHS